MSLIHHEPLPVPTRGGSGDPWELPDALAEADLQAEADERARRLEAAVLRTRRRMAAEQTRRQRQRRGRR